MKRSIKKFLLIGITMCISGALSAQSMKWADGQEAARKLSTDIYELVPAGVMSCKIENNQFWELAEGVRISDKPRLYLKHEDGQVFYYDNEDNIKAYFIPSQGRYYVATSEGSVILKDASIAVLVDGKLYGPNGDVHFTVDEGFTPEIVGFFLFSYFF